MEIADLDEQFDRLLALIPVAKDVEQLEHIGTLIDIDMTGIAGNRKALLRKIVTHLNSDDFDNNADRERLIISARDSMLTHLNIMPDLEGFQAAHDNGNLHVKENDSEDSDHDSDAEYQDALNDLRKQKKDKKTASAAVMSASVKLKDFKISGTVGEPGEKGKLTYGSLAHQINTGIDRGFDETEVIAAVIRAITPGHTTRTYLEGKRKLTLAKLMSTMKAHFGEKDVTELEGYDNCYTRNETDPSEIFDEHVCNEGSSTGIATTKPRKRTTLQPKIVASRNAKGNLCRSTR